MFDLPDPGSYRLTRAPLVLAAVQVQFPLIGRLQELAGITPVQEAIRDVFPYMERQQTSQLTLAFGPAGPVQPPAAEATVSWKFTDDAGWAALVEPGSATLVVGREYTHVDDFQLRFDRILLALRDAAQVPRCDRIGVRYINVAQIAPGDTTWAQWFRPELAGWIATDIFEPATTVASSISQTSLVAPGTGQLTSAPHQVQAIVRHGLLPQGTTIPVSSLAPLEPLSLPSFILDIDGFIVGPQPFRVELLQQQFLGLHEQIDRFFYWSLAEPGLQHFGIERR